MSPPLLTVVAFVVGLLALVVAVVVFLQRRSASPSVLIVGPCGAGKTLLFYRLVENEVCQTVSSMRRNEAMLGDVALVDFPGHSRLRGGLADELRRCVKVVFVIDAASASTQVKPAAELLFQILTTLQGSNQPIMVLCNKSDKATAKSPQRIKLMLMNEIETLRKTAGTISTIGDPAATGGSDRKTLGVEGQFFNFDTHSPCPISFESASILTSDTVAPVAAFVGLSRR